MSDPTPAPGARHAPDLPALVARARKLGLLALLYLSQGLPFGFQSKALPIYLREAGVDLSTIGFASALAVPWALKALWAPLVERYTLPGFGRRKTWILPMQLGMTLACAAAACLPEGPRSLYPLLGLIFLMNLFAATMDIAVDGLAVDVLDSSELGLGNTTQVVGFKVGMLVSSGVLVYLTPSLGWLFGVMALLVLVVAVVVWVWPEPAAPHAAPSDAEGQPSLREILRALWAALNVPGGVWLLVFVATYKLGEGVVDLMWLPYLVDAGFTRDQIAVWNSGYGMGFSLLGSLLGGVLASAVPVWRALVLACALRLGPMVLQWLLADGWIPLTPESVVWAIGAEAIGGGALTVVTFAFMMARVDRSIGATHYTLLATVEVQGKGLIGLFSGVLAAWLGYGALFGLGLLLSLICFPVLWPLRPPREPAGEPPPGAC